MQSQDQEQQQQQQGGRPGENRTSHVGGAGCWRTRGSEYCSCKPGATGPLEIRSWCLPELALRFGGGGQSQGWRECASGMVARVSEPEARTRGAEPGMEGDPCKGERAGAAEEEGVGEEGVGVALGVALWREAPAWLWLHAAASIRRPALGHLGSGRELSQGCDPHSSVSRGLGPLPG